MNTSATHSPRRIEATAFALFQSAQTQENRRFITHMIIPATALASLFVEGYVLYTIGVFALVVGARAFLYRIVASRLNDLGYSIHRVSMLAKAYRMNGEHFDVANLLSNVPPDIHREAARASQSEDSSGVYTAPVDETGASRLRWMIQENAYFNATLYGACADRAFKFVMGTFAVLLLCVLLTIPLASGTTEYMVLRVVLIVLSLSIVYDQIERWSSWRVAAQVMRDLEMELSRFRTVPDYRVLLLFSNYHVAIAGAHEITPTVYTQNRDKLNDGWQQRVAELKQEWSDAG